ncbi:MAG: pyridoxal phosphate-dependent aminotransferase [Candidatus Undinarchaeales archaeon]|jgi:aspartate/methionine/tyrosine aminotransferase|nr:pyridoxal phosphate-dependent aminotransferase [Candidatus Undinarchaeales archaeon]MDP7493203.1 pyridoxal phosphate-dependent aminotransferase [Candidatus Undinarchaeales archaeon]
MKVNLARKMNGIKPSDIRRLFDLAQGMPGVISLGIGEPDFGTPDHIREAAKRAIDEERICYTPNAGIAALREALADKYGREGMVYDSSSEVLITAGATEAVSTAILGHVKTGDEVIVPDPAFLIYTPLVQLAGGTPKYLPLLAEDGYRFDADRLAEQVNKKTRMIVVNYPCNPTGMTMGTSDLRAIAEIAEDNGTILLSDEVYDRLTFDGKRHVSMGTITDNAIVINSFSKTYAMTGFRVGYALGRRELIGPMLRVHQFNVASLTVPSQHAALAAATGPDDCVEHMCAEYEARRNLLVRELDNLQGVSYLVPEGAFYFYLDVSDTGMTGLEFSERMLKEALVVVVPGNAFGDVGHHHVRISYAASSERLMEACERMRHVLE